MEYAHAADVYWNGSDEDDCGESENMNGEGMTPSVDEHSSMDISTDLMNKNVKADEEVEPLNLVVDSGQRRKIEIEKEEDSAFCSDVQLAEQLKARRV